MKSICILWFKLAKKSIVVSYDTSRCEATLQLWTRHQGSPSSFLPLMSKRRVALHVAGGMRTMDDIFRIESDRKLLGDGQLDVFFFGDKTQSKHL